MGLVEDLIKEAADTKAHKAKMGAVAGVLLTAGSVITSVTNARADKNSDLIKVPHSSEFYRGKNYLEVQKELIAYGFLNIGMLDKKKPLFGKAGAVQEVLINNKKNFSEGKRFQKDVRVVIVYNR